MAKPPETAPVPRGRGHEPATASTRAEIDAFLDRIRALDSAPTPGQRGRLVFALDATMSRQPTWDTACRLQADMFNETRLSAGSMFSSCISAAWGSAGLPASCPIRARWQA